MTRREFVALPALAVAASGRVALSAIAAATMPDTLFLSRETVQDLMAGKQRFVEKRVYSSELDLRRVFREMGMPVVLGRAHCCSRFRAWKQGSPRGAVWLPIHAGYPALCNCRNWEFTN